MLVCQVRAEGDAPLSLLCLSINNNHLFNFLNSISVPVWLRPPTNRPRLSSGERKPLGQTRAKVTSQVFILGYKHR